MITIMYKIDEEKWRLTGCEGIHETSVWKCEYCDEEKRLVCQKLLNAHPDLIGRPVA